MAVLQSQIAPEKAAEMIGEMSVEEKSVLQEAQKDFSRNII